MRALLTLCALLFVCTARPAFPIPHSPFPTPHSSRVVVVVANRLLLSDLVDTKLPTISKMLREGAIGLVCPNCTGPKTECSVMLTANAGAPCRTGAYLKEFYDSDELLPDGTTAGDAYTVRTGRKAPPGSAVFAAIGQAMRDSAKANPAPAALGALGDVLGRAGVRTAVVGNADLPPDVIDRSAAALVTDCNGIVDDGRLRDPLPSGKPPRIGEGMTLIYFGASTRLDEMQPRVSDAAYASHKTEMLRHLDSLLLGLSARVRTQQASLMLISFSPPRNPHSSWDQLTPVIIYPTPSPGILTSSTTRTPGLIAASDFAPTILGLLHLHSSDDMIGRAAIVLPDANSVARLRDLAVRVTTDERMLLPIAVGLAAVGVLSFTVAALLVAFPKRRRPGLAGLCKAGLVTVACAPAALLLGVLAPAGALGYLAGTAISLVVLVAISMLVGRAVGTDKRALPIVVAYGITCAVILADGFSGCNLGKFSALSSYQIAGMRFYGIGNEYAGVLIGMAAMATLFAIRGAKSEVRNSWLVAIAGAVVAVALGLGSFGANYGAVVATAVTFGLMWRAVRKGGFGARHVAIAFAVGVAGMVAFALLDWKLAGGSGTHAARATGMTEKLGGGYLESVALRKVLFNLKTTFSVKGIVPALAFSPFLALWFWGIQGKVRNLFKDHLGVIAGAKSVLVGAAVTYMVEDSGIVFGATMVAMTVLVLLYSVLEAGAEGPHPNPPRSGEGV